MFRQAVHKSRPGSGGGVAFHPVERSAMPRGNGEGEGKARRPAISLGGEGATNMWLGLWSCPQCLPACSRVHWRPCLPCLRQSQSGSPPKIRRRELLSQPPLSARECLSCLRAGSADFPDPDRDCRVTRRATTRVRQADRSRCLLLELDAVLRWSGRACPRCCDRADITVVLFVAAGHG